VLKIVIGKEKNKDWGKILKLHVNQINGLILIKGNLRDLRNKLAVKNSPTIILKLSIQKIGIDLDQEKGTDLQILNRLVHSINSKMVETKIFGIKRGKNRHIDIITKRNHAKGILIYKIRCLTNLERRKESNLSGNSSGPDKRKLGQETKKKQNKKTLKELINSNEKTMNKEG